MLAILLNTLFHISYIVGIFSLGFIFGKKHSAKSKLKNETIITTSK